MFSDFVIENGILKSYAGQDSPVIIPDGVAEIRESVFEGCSTFCPVITQQTGNMCKIVKNIIATLIIAFL